MIKYFAMKKAERDAKAFIEDCLGYDVPRMASEVFPGDVKVEADVPYLEDGKKEHLLDVYYPFNTAPGKQAFFLIHGGAFVYGAKENDKNFGMRLASKSGIPVVNINYTLMPEVSLSEQLNEIVSAMNFATAKYGFTIFHTVGDSAGGYLAMVTAMIANNRHYEHEMWVFEKVNASVESVACICGMYVANKHSFPGILFNKKDNKESRLPEYVYDLNTVVDRCSDYRFTVVTGEDDFLRQENLNMRDNLKNVGIDVLFYDAANTPERKMAHVYPITDPTSPEGEKVIALISENAVSRK